MNRMMNNNYMDTQSGERLSFYKLFQEKKYRVQIPIIQRDYAQGRKSTEEVRNTFLEALETYLAENKPNRDLDFVYGSLIKSEGMTNFTPLDGQQRLTTLFLLHWYLCQISTNHTLKEEFLSSILISGKSLFSYETRSSSAEFCDALMSNAIDIENRHVSNNNQRNGISDAPLSNTIRNQSWFYLSWQYDPTIQSMLTMLDAIDKRFVNKSEYFERLLDLESPIITFLFLDLNDFKLTDDLYIKMNSRGKPLTTFENFKAKYEQYLESIDCQRKFSLKYVGEDNEVEVSFKDYFSYSIDTVWANLFWNYRSVCQGDKKDSDNTFDDELMNFIRVIFTFQYAMDVDVTLKDKDDSLEYILGTQVAKKREDYSDVISFNKYKELNALNSNSFLYLIDAFNALSNGNEKIKLHIDEYKFYFNEEEVFERALLNDHNFSNQERICLHAYLRFLIQNSDTTGLGQWMRVIHNLTHPENTVIDNASEVAAAIRSVEELLPHSGNILEYLKGNPTISLFSTWQITEEKVKAHLITIDDRWQRKITDIERHRYFNGQIGFMLQFAGIMEYYHCNGHCNWSETQNTEYFSSFSNYADKASVIFDHSYDNRVNNESYLFERAVLTKGDYMSTASQYRKNLLSTSLVKNNIKRDHSWKRVLRISDDGTQKDRHSIIKQVFDDTRLEVNDIARSLELICLDRTNTWRDYLISYPALISYCRQGFIRYDGKDYILLYGESQSNHMHVELYSYYLWERYIKAHKVDFMPFSTIEYIEVKSIDDYAHVLFNGFCHKMNYQVELHYCDRDDLRHPYELKFVKSKGENSCESYGSDVQEILKKCAFEWSTEYEGYFFTCEVEGDVITHLKLLSQMLNNMKFNTPMMH